MSEVKEHSVIYLSPSDDPEREWCQDDVWDESVRYNLGADFDRVTAERDALQQRLTAADERADVLEGLLRRVVDSSVLSFEQDAPEELESLEADICPAFKPSTAGDCHHGYASILECPECGAPYQ